MYLHFTTGYRNTILGYEQDIQQLQFTNVYLGYQADFVIQLVEPISIGSNSQQGVSGQTTGQYNVSIGEQSLLGLYNR